jgi:hypothetical protein
MAEARLAAMAFHALFTVMVAGFLLTQAVEAATPSPSPAGPRHSPRWPPGRC